MKRLWNVLISLELCLWLLALVSLAMAAGSFLLSGEYAAAINAMPLYFWLTGVPLEHSWWLWLTVVMLTLLALATLACTFEALRQRLRNVSLLSLLAPQFIHIGFLLIVAAHLISAFTASMEQIEVFEGSSVQLPDSKTFRVAAISAEFSPQGMPTGFSSDLQTDLLNPMLRTVISPNHPWFSSGYGVYIKQAEIYPYRRALLEVHREPGAVFALVGATVFTIGNVLLLWVRSKRRD